MAEVRSYHNDHMAWKAENIYYMALLQKQTNQNQTPPPQLSWSLNYRIAVIQGRSNGGSDQGGSTDGSEKCLDSGYVWN